MDLGSWQKKSTDVVRIRRLALGSVAGTAIMGSTLAFVGLTAAKAYGLDEDQIVEAVIVDGPTEDAPIEAQPEPEKETPKARKLTTLEAPVKIDDKLVEKEPVAGSDNPYGSDDPYALLQNAEQAPEPERPKVAEAPKIVEKPKVVVPRSTEPIRITEDDTPPRAVSMQAPSYPAEAKAAGVEGTVVVKYVVTETGEVRDVQAVRGPPELVAVCEEAVKSWRFMPALREGKAVAAHRLARFPFRIKT